MISACNMYCPLVLFLKHCLKQFLMQVHISYILHYIILYYIISYHISYYITSYHIIYHFIYHTISYHILYHIISHHIISYHHIISCHIISYYIILYYIILYYIILYYIIIYSYITPLLYIFVNNTFIVHFTNNFSIYSCDTVCKGKELCPNYSRNFCWMNWEGQMLACDEPIPVACPTYVWCCVWHIWSTTHRGWITLKLAVFVWQTTTHIIVLIQKC
jgi:hypothetical protein